MHDQVTIFVAFLAGTFSFLSPCVLPPFPSYLSFITGMSVEELAATESRFLRPVVKNSLLFISGFSLVFIAMGASAGFLGEMLFNYRNIMQVLGGILIIFFGLYIMGILKLTFLGRYFQLNLGSRPAGVFGSLLIAASFAIGWTPCVGPILGSILTLAASTGRTNTGLTAVIDARGQRRQTLPTFTPATLQGQVELMDGKTPYVLYGDWFAWAASLISAAIMLDRAKQKRWLTGNKRTTSLSKNH